MTVIELRKELVRKINRIESNDLLAEMFELVDKGMLDSSNDIVLTEVKKIKKSKLKTISDAEADAEDIEIENWLNNMIS